MSGTDDTGRGGRRPVLSVRDLTVQVATEAGAKTVLDGLSFDLVAGETLALAGESGSGKSMTALAIMGLLPKPMARITSGAIRLGETELTTLDEADYRRIRSARIAMIFQEPMTSLNPLMRVETQLCEVLLEHGICARGEAPARALRLLQDVRLTEPERRLKQYPHELSGGMRQRVMIAMALACEPEILIADEPTTALDVTVQAEILDLVRTLQREHGTAVLMITHDMGVVAEMADRVVVLRAGREEEQAPVRDLFAAPRTDYARTLLAAVPRLGTASARARAGGGTQGRRGGRPLGPLRPRRRAAQPDRRTGPCGRERVVPHPRGRDAGAGGRVGVRQVHHRQGAAGPRPVGGLDPRRRGADRRPVARRHAAGAARHPDGVPGPRRLARRADAGGRAGDGADAGPRHRHRFGTGRPGRMAVPAGRPLARHAAALPARILRRPAAADLHRPRPQPRAQGHRRRRERLRPRRERAGAGARSACANFRRRTGWPISSSVTTWRWSSRSRTGSWSCVWAR